MTELTLISTNQRPLKPLVEAALANELRLLEAGIRRTEHNGCSDLKKNTSCPRVNSSIALRKTSWRRL